MDGSPRSGLRNNAGTSWPKAFGVSRENSNYRNGLARNSLFFANREFDHREQGNSVPETRIFASVITVVLFGAATRLDAIRMDSGSRLRRADLTRRERVPLTASQGSAAGQQPRDAVRGGALQICPAKLGLDQTRRIGGSLNAKVPVSTKPGQLHLERMPSARYSTC